MSRTWLTGLLLGLPLLAGPALAAPHTARLGSLDGGVDEGLDNNVEHVADGLVEGGAGDGVYGRFDGNFSVSGGLGVAYHSASSELLPKAHVSTKFYQTVGLYAAFAQAVTSAPLLVRDFEVGVTIEPLFLLRFSRADEWGRAFWDLTFDSLSLSVGAHAAQPAGADFGDRWGLCLGLGAGVPLLARAPGPWVRVRGAMQTGADHLEGTAEVWLEWQWMVSLWERRP